MNSVWKQDLAAIALLALVGALCAGCTGQPSATVEPVMSDEYYIQESIDKAWEGYTGTWGSDTPRPEVEIERLIAHEDWAQVMVDCLHGEGFPDVLLEEDNSFSSQNPTGQLQAYDLAVYVCSARFPKDAKHLRPPTRNQVIYLYHYYRDVQAPCLEAEGYSIPDAPSEQEFIESIGSKDQWSPYATVGFTTQEEWDRINELCPQDVDEGYFDVE